MGWWLQLEADNQNLSKPVTKGYSGKFSMGFFYHKLTFMEIAMMQ